MSDHNAADTPDRKTVADHLYRTRGPKEASARCDANAKYGKVDLCDEMLRHSEIAAGMTLYDVGCGSGQHLVRYLEAVGEGGTARGFDFSEKAIDNTRARGIQADVADAGSLPVADASADRLTSAYSIYYVPDLDKTIAEWARVLKSGGRAVVAGPADDTNAELYAFHLDITGGGLADVDKLSLGYVQDRLPPAFRAHGFADARVEVISNPIDFPTIDEFVDYWTSTSLFARGVDDADRDKVIAAGRAKLAQQQAPFTITKRVAIAIAARS